MPSPLGLLSVSMGVARLDRHQLTSTGQWIEQADYALYDANQSSAPPLGESCLKVAPKLFRKRLIGCAVSVYSQSQRSAANLI